MTSVLPPGSVYVAACPMPTERCSQITLETARPFLRPSSAVKLLMEIADQTLVLIDKAYRGVTDTGISQMGEHFFHIVLAPHRVDNIVSVHGRGYDMLIYATHKLEYVHCRIQTRGHICTWRARRDTRIVLSIRERQSILRCVRLGNRSFRKHKIAEHRAQLCHGNPTAHCGRCDPRGSEGRHITPLARGIGGAGGFGGVGSSRGDGTTARSTGAERSEVIVRARADVPHEGGPPGYDRRGEAAVAVSPQGLADRIAALAALVAPSPAHRAHRRGKLLRVAARHHICTAHAKKSERWRERHRPGPSVVGAWASCAGRCPPLGCP